MPDPIRLDAERDIGLYELALAAAQAGALGGAVGGAGVRAIPQRDAIRAAAAATSDELFNQKNLEQAIRDSASYKNRTMFTRMHPDDFLALARDFGDFPDHVDPGPPPPGGWGPSPDKQARIRQAIESGVPLSDIPILKMSGEGRVYGHEGRHRALAMRGRGFESLPVELISSNIRWSEQQDPKDWDYQKELPSELGSESPEYKTPAHRTRPAPYHTEGPLRGLPLDTPAIRRPIGRRIAGGLSRLGKAALNPVSILTDAAIGSVVGAGSALAGYEWSRPKSAGVFTAPGPGYEDALTQADILEIARGKELEKKARLEQYIEEALATGARIPADPRIEDLAEVLGPVR